MEAVEVPNVIGIMRLLVRAGKPADTGFNFQIAEEQLVMTIDKAQETKLQRYKS